jgi:TM2 domain-containing membrane protein YozV
MTWQPQDPSFDPQNQARYQVPDPQAQIQPQPEPQIQPQAQPPQAQPPQAQYGVYGQQNMPPGGYPVAGQQPVVAPRSPAIALLLSFFIPGLGSMVNGRVGIGALILGLYILGYILILVFVGIFVVIGVWIWGMIDAYQAAQAWNRAHGIIS